jgi:uncharacterized protein (UPF0548 family)
MSNLSKDGRVESKARRIWHGCQIIAGDSRLDAHYVNLRTHLRLRSWLSTTAGTTVFLLSKPDELTIQRFIESQSSLDVNYSGIGSTSGTPPTDYIVDQTRAKLGKGEAAFQRARAALRQWAIFQLGWVEPCWTDTPIEPNRTVAILAHTLGLWSLNACRIIYVVQEEEKFGFAYGTLPDHVESGEERFTVEWNRDDDSVSYEIVAFSRPNHFLTRFAYPMTRRLQKRFARDSVAAMKLAVARP